MGNLKESVILASLFKKCMELKDINERIEILQSINALLADKYKVNIPSLVTNAFIDKALYNLELILPAV